MQQRWKIYTKKADFYGLAEKLNITPYLVRLMRNRDLTELSEMEQYLYGSREDLAKLSLMADLDLAARILKEKIENNAWIRIIGDYDADGINSIYILHVALRALGARVDWVIPDRIRDGYGLNMSFVEQAAADGVDTLLTCDNGIAAIEAIDAAKKAGMTVVITDHHAIRTSPDDPEREILPAADAIVNPHRSDCRYPFKNLCGAGVAFYLMRYLYPMFGRSEQEIWDRFLPFAAIATVADVMELKGENRVLVKEGLRAIGRSTHPGLNALIEIQELKRDRLSATAIGFQLAPVMNAGGRLDNAKRVVDLLLTEDPDSAMRQAAELKALNDLRKTMTEEGVELACAMVEETALSQDKVLVIFLPECHESLAGIIAGRIRERYNRPTIVLTRGREGLKGSGRSTENYSMFEKLCECDDLLVRYGGHPMAAGVSLEEENLEAFRRRLNENCGLTDEDLIPVVWLDMQLPFEAVTPRLIEELELLEPFGTGNHKPVFGEREVRITGLRVIGKNRNVLRMNFVNAQNVAMSAVRFGDPEEFFAEVRETYGESAITALLQGRANPVRMTILYYPAIDTYGGKYDLQIYLNSWKLQR